MLRIDLQLPTQGFGRNAALRRNAMGMRETLLDPAVLGAVLIVLVLGIAAYYFQGNATQGLADARVRLQRAVQDSSLLQTEIEQSDELKRQESLVNQKIAQIRAIDRGRYAFTHLMDEASTALPTDVWIRRISAEGANGFLLEGSAASEDLVARFLQDLEGSPFIVGAQLANTSQATVNEQTVLEFQIRGQLEQPDPSFLQTETIGPDGTAVRGGSVARGAETAYPAAPSGAVVPGPEGLPAVPQIGGTPPASSGAVSPSFPTPTDTTRSTPGSPSGAPSSVPGQGELP